MAFKLGTPYTPQFEDSGGIPEAGGSIEFYIAGTSTPQAIYFNAAGSSSATSVDLDVLGMPDNSGSPVELYYDDSVFYDIVIKDSDGATIRTIYSYTPTGSESGLVSLAVEAQDTTAGQTVFTLTSITNDPGTNSIRMLYNGVEYESGVDFQETDSTTITWINTDVTIADGKRVKFVRNSSVTSSAVSGSNVSYTPEGANTVATDIQSRMRQLLQTPYDYGGIPDTAADQQTVFQAMVDPIGSGETRHYWVPDGAWLIGSDVTLGAGADVVWHFDANASMTGAGNLANESNAISYVAEGMTIGGTLTVGTLAVTGSFTPATLAVTGALTAGSISTTGTLQGANTTITGTLGVTGAGTFSSTLAAGNTTITGTCGVSSTLTAGALSTAGTLAAGTSTITGTLTATSLVANTSLSCSTGTVTLNNTSIIGTFNAGAGTFSSTLTAGDTTTDDLTFDTGRCDAIQYGSLGFANGGTYAALELSIGGRDDNANQDYTDAFVLQNGLNSAQLGLTNNVVGGETYLSIDHSSIAGTCDINGTAVTWVSGSAFDDCLSQRIWLNGTAYTVASVNSSTSITLASSYGVASGVDFVIKANALHSKVSTSGTTVTRVSGHVFNPFGTTCFINGIKYTYSYVNQDTISLTASAGTQSNVECFTLYANDFSNGLILKVSEPDTGAFVNKSLTFGHAPSATTSAGTWILKGADAGTVGGAAPLTINMGSSNVLFATDGTTIFYDDVSHGGDCLPFADGVGNVGSGSYRWDTVYATTGTINTSDERNKQDVASLSDIEKTIALELKQHLSTFRFKDRVEQKGDKARKHAGIVAQVIVDVFADNGLNAHDYGMLCYDEWQDENGAHDRYGVRYDELFAFIIAAL